MVSCILDLYYVDLLIEEALYMKKILSFVIIVLLLSSYGISAFAGIMTATDPLDGSGGTVAETGTDSDGNILFTATPKSGYEFDGWTISDTGAFTTKNPVPITPRDTTITARFSKTSYTVSVNASPTGVGTVSGGGTFYYGDSVTLSAEAGIGYDFAGWSGIAPNPATQTLTVTSDITAVANFTPQVHKITASVDPAGSGYVNSSTSYDSGPVTYEPGKVVGIKAQPETGYQFDGWYEGGSRISTTTDEIFDIFRDRTLVAKFVPSGSPTPEPVTPSAEPGPGPGPYTPDPYHPYKGFKITYHPGVYGAEPAVQDTVYPGIGWLRGTTFTRPGYIQAGWSWDPYGREFNAALNAPMPMLYENITVYPYWEPIKGPLVLTVGYSGSGAIQVHGRYVYNGESFTIRPGESLTFGFYPASGNYVYSILLAGRYREYPGYGFTVNYDMMQNRNQTLAVRFESIYTRPKTGDDSNIGLWLALGVCSAVCLGVLVFVKKKK